MTTTADAERQPPSLIEPVELVERRPDGPSEEISLMSGGVADIAGFGKVGVTTTNDPPALSHVGLLRDGAPGAGADVTVGDRFGVDGFVFEVVDATSQELTLRYWEPPGGVPASSTVATESGVPPGHGSSPPEVSILDGAPAEAGEVVMPEHTQVDIPGYGALHFRWSEQAPEFVKVVFRPTGATVRQGMWVTEGDVFESEGFVFEIGSIQDRAVRELIYWPPAG